MTKDFLLFFQFDSFSYRGEKILRDLGLEVDFVPTPKEFHQLCTNSLRVQGASEKELKEILEKNNIAYAMIHPYKASKLAMTFLEEPREDILSKIAQDLPLHREDIEALFNLTEKQEKFCFLAGKLRDQVVGRRVEIGGILHLRKETDLREILKIGQSLAKFDFLMLVLGENLPKKELVGFLKAIPTGCQLIATGGKDIFGHYKELKQAGITKIFKAIDNDYSVNPKEVLEEILFLWQEGKSISLGQSPLLPVLFSTKESDLALGQTITALCRILFKDALLPAFNCATSLREGEQISLVEAGANLVLLELNNLSSWDLLVKQLSKKDYTTNLK